jgi:hypothetical protein
MSSSGESVGREVTLLDGDWTPQQAQGLLDSLKLNCGMPGWRPEALKRLHDWCSSHQEDAGTVEAPSADLGLWDRLDWGNANRKEEAPATGGTPGLRVSVLGGKPVVGREAHHDSVITPGCVFSATAHR